MNELIPEALFSVRYKNGIGEPPDKLHTAYEWNDILNHGIVDYDGFRDGDITTETKMTKEEFLRRSIQSTRKVI